MKEQVLESIRKEKIIVIIRGVPSEKMLPLCEALYDGGIRLVEITFDPTGKIPVGETAEQIKTVAAEFENRMFVGAGTVINTKYAEIAVGAGAKYLISPNLDVDVIRYANENGVVALPGVMTPTEAVNAYSAGADMVKVFPSDALGLAYIKALRAPLAYIPMLAVGGVNEKNISDFLKIGVAGAGIGSNIVKKDMVANGDFAGITALAKVYTQAVRDYEAGKC